MLITEAIFSKDSDKVFYLKADVYTNYSPVASKAPHDFDIYMLNSETRNIERLTNMQAYKISSLTIHENQLYFIKPKDAKTREEIFESGYHIYTLFINQPKEITEVAFERKEKDIYSFTISPDGKKILFTAIANRGNGKLFEYELYELDRRTGKVKQLTYLNAAVSNPIFSKRTTAIYFMVDLKFGSQRPDYRLYKMESDEGKPEQIPLQF